MKKIFLPILLAVIITSCSKNDGAGSGGGKGTPVILTVGLKKDTLTIIGKFGPDPGIGLRRVIINDQPVADSNVKKWDKDTVKAVIETNPPGEKKVEVEVLKEKSNAVIINVTQMIDIHYLQVKEPASELYIYGVFGTDPGMGKRFIRIDTVTLGKYTTDIISWTNNLIIARIPNEGDGSKGKVTVKTATDSASRTLYEFNGVLWFKRPQGGASGTLMEDVSFHIKLRGDAEPVNSSPNIYNLATNLHVESWAHWEAGGQGSSSYNNIDGCATIKVNWPNVHGNKAMSLNNNFPLNGIRWRSVIKHRKDGFDLRISFDAPTVIESSVWTFPCDSPSFIEFRKESIYFDEFDDVVIPLRTKNGTIQPGELKKTVTSTAGLHWDASEFPLHFMTATLGWNTFYGSY